MVKTYAKKMEARDDRLKALGRSDRLARSAQIKRKEGRVLSASEKHALKMTGELGEILHAWEALRTAKGLTEDGVTTKEEQVNSLLKLISPKFDTLARTPKVSRVLQSCVKWGTAKQFAKISRLVEKDFVHFSCDSFAHYLVTAVLRHAPHQIFTRLLEQTARHMHTLVTNKFGLEVIHTTYSHKRCSATDKNLLMMGVFRDNVVLQKQWKGYPVIEDVLRLEVLHRKRLVNTLFALTDKLISQKQSYHLPFIQRLVLAYLKNGARDESLEMATGLKLHLHEIALVAEGSLLASTVFSLVDPHQRREVLGSLTGSIAELCSSKYGAPFVARLFDLVSDAQVLYKYILRKMLAEDVVGSMFDHPFAHMVLLHVLTPDQERKERALLPKFFDHNLYHRGNNSWNHHTWTDAAGESETVEICSKPADATHKSVLKYITKAIVEHVKKASAEGASGVSHFTKRLVKEIVHLHDNEPDYKPHLMVNKDEIAILRKNLPNKSTREEKEYNESAPNAPKRSGKKRAAADAPAAAPAKEKKLRKKELTSKRTKAKA